MNAPQAIPSLFATVAALALGAVFEDGTYGGITTKPDGTPVAVVFLGVSDQKSSHAGCVAWATERGGELVTRAVFHLLRATVREQLPKDGWCWTADTLDQDTGDESDASYAWLCNFVNGHAYDHRKSYERQAVAVRLIPLTA